MQIHGSEVRGQTFLFDIAYSEWQGAIDILPKDLGMFKVACILAAQKNHSDLSMGFPNKTSLVLVDQDDQALLVIAHYCPME